MIDFSWSNILWYIAFKVNSVLADVSFLDDLLMSAMLRENVLNLEKMPQVAYYQRV